MQQPSSSPWEAGTTDFDNTDDIDGATAVDLDSGDFDSTGDSKQTDMSSGGALYAGIVGGVIAITMVAACIHFKYQQGRGRGSAEFRPNPNAPPPPPNTYTPVT